MKWILRPVRLSQSNTIPKFMFRILIQQFAVKTIVAVLMVLLLNEADVADRSTLMREPIAAFLIFVILAPLLETLLLQTAPIETFRALRRSRLSQLLAGSLPFAALHFVGGVASGVAAGIVGGVFFSHTYLECRSRSWWTSTWVTAVTHSLHNLIVLPVAMLLAA